MKFCGFREYHTQFQTKVVKSMTPYQTKTENESYLFEAIFPYKFVFVSKENKK